MRRWLPLALLALLAITAPAAADELRIDGAFTQGGLAIGHAPPGSAVSIDGRAVRVAADGTFLIGFGRDAGPSVTLTLSPPGAGARMQTLAVAKRDFPVQRIDGLPPKQVTPDPATLARIRAEAQLIDATREKDTALPLFLSGFVWPVQGRLSGVFGSQRILNGQPRSPHSGVDIAAPKGAPVLATADGTVTLVHEDMFYTGKTIVLDHGFGLSSVYAHMATLLVHPGQRVAKGSPIGAVGSSGRATGPHLHWGVSLFDTRLDPALLAGPPDAG